MNNKYLKFLLFLIIVIFLCGSVVNAESTKNLKEKAAALEKQGNYADAVAAYNQALQIDRWDPVIYQNKVIDLLKLGLEKDAQNTIKLAKEKGIVIEITSEGTVEAPGLEGNYYKSPITSTKPDEIDITSMVPNTTQKSGSTSVPVESRSNSDQKSKSPNDLTLTDIFSIP